MLLILVFLKTDLLFVTTVFLRLVCGRLGHNVFVVVTALLRPTRLRFCAQRVRVDVYLDSGQSTRRCLYWQVPCWLLGGGHVISRGAPYGDYGR